MTSPGAAGIAPAELFTAALRHHGAGRFAEAQELYLRILALEPRHADSLHMLGCLAHQAGRADVALDLIGRAIAIRADVALYHHSLGNVLMAGGRLDEAARQFARAVAVRPDFAEAHNNLGTVHHRRGLLDDAISHYQRALALNPALPQTHANLATIFRDQGRLALAAAGFEQALALAPDFAEVHGSLAIVRKEQGRLGEALAGFRRALALKPDAARLHSGLLMALCYSPDLDDDGLAAACRDWGRRHGRLSEPRVPLAPADGASGRPLRVGYVSSDLRRHPVGWFLAAVWPAHDPAEVTIHAYSGVVVEDAMTRHLRAHAAVWRETTRLSDADLAAQIRADNIDVLVDLDGHTERNRLTVFAHRPAPVQITWLGHGHTTGLDAIDAALMDEDTAPPGAERWFSEAVIRLPGGRLCYAPPDYAPPVGPPPCLSRGRVTFGSFNNLAKVSPAVLRVWAGVLAATPGATLRLHWKSLADQSERTRLRAAFAAVGGCEDRLELGGAMPHPELLAAYGDIDIALDSFPFGGGLTSCEALWMGVPVVTWPGSRPLSRQTLGFLSALGLAGELAADSAEAYVALAAGLAAAPDRLAALRAELRPRMAASALCDGPRMARALEAAYRAVWFWPSPRPPGSP